MRTGARVLRIVRVGGRVLPRMRGRAPAEGASAGQPKIFADPRGTGLEPETAAALARENRGASAARNGHDLDGRSGPRDNADAVELRGGADARRGDLAP